MANLSEVVRVEKINALIVDDEPIARRGIRRLLRAEPDIEIVGECADGREAIAAIERQRPDLIFLDVQMPLMDGFGVVEAVGVENMPAVVFVTAYDEHAIHAFEVHALDYLLKPVDPERFQQTVARARRQFETSKSKRLGHQLSALLKRLDELKATTEEPLPIQRIAVKEPGRISFLSVDEIDWFRAQGNYVQLHAGRDTHMLRETVDGLERKLDRHKFVRVRRSTIVRAEQIKELQPLFNGEYTVILKDGTQLRSSRRYRKNLYALMKG